MPDRRAAERGEPAGPKEASAIRALRTHLQFHHVVSYFTSPADLEARVSTAVTVAGMSRQVRHNLAGVASSHIRMPISDLFEGIPTAPTAPMIVSDKTVHVEGPRTAHPPNITHDCNAASPSDRSSKTVDVRLLRFGTLISFCATCVGCAATAPQAIPNLPLDANTPIFLTAARQKEALSRSLRDAGLHIVDTPSEGAYLLRATVGTSQGSRECGTLNNVRYSLRSNGRNVVEVEAKGWTGTCDPNVFDVLSRELRRRISPRPEQEAPPS